MGEQPLVHKRAVFETRCPYCHDALVRGGVECGVCGARHHTVCLDEAPRCATCGEDLSDKYERALIRAAHLRNHWWVRWFPDRRYHFWYQRTRQWTYRPLILVSLAGAVGLTIFCHWLSLRF